jgi:hypothetical protein
MLLVSVAFNNNGIKWSGTGEFKFIGIWSVYCLQYADILEVLFTVQANKTSVSIVAQHCAPTMTPGHVGCPPPRKNVTDKYMD